jgi:lipoprotein|nr:MAG TPA: hypothetical protein [Caudoviricetes sp.]
MTDRLDGVENALSEMIREKYPEGALVGAWIVSCEVLTTEANEDSRALWFLEGRGSLITRRGLIELSRDVLARTVKETDE